MSAYQSSPSSTQGHPHSLMRSLKGRTGLLALGCILASAPTYAMAQVEWICPTDGSYENPGCWSGKMVPASGDIIEFDLGAAYSIILPEISMGYQEVGGMLINGDDVSLNIINDYRYFDTSAYLYVQESTEDRDNAAAMRLVQGEVNTLKFFLFDGILDVAPEATMTCTDFTVDSGSSLMVDVGSGFNWTAFSMYNGASGTVNLDGSLVVNIADSEYGIPLGSSRTVFETNFDGSLTIGQPFPSVFTNPPLGREFEITGNEPGSTSIVATLVFSSTYTEDEFNEEDELPSEAIAVVTGDLSDNGYDDIVLVMPDDKIRVYETTLSGGLLGPYEYPVGADPVDAAIGDYDGNGLNDIVVINQTDSSCSVYLNFTGNPAGLSLYETYTTEKTPTAVVNCDLGDDEDEGNAFLPVARARDIVIVSKGDGGDGGRATGYRGASDGLRQVASIIIEEEPDSADPADDEEKKDEDDDIVVGHGRAADGFTQGATGSPSLTLIRGNSDGSLTILQSGVPVSSNPTEAAALSIDGANYVAVSTEGGSIELYKRLVGTGGILSLETSLQVGESVLSIGASDLDGDSRKDIVASVGSMGDASVILYRNKSTGAGIIDFQQANEVEFDQPTGRLAVGRLFTIDGDKKEGVAGTTAPSDSSTASLFTGYFFESPTPDCLAADFNGDNMVNGIDLGQLVGAWGPCEGCPEDLNRDGVVNGADLGLMFNVWGVCID